MASAGYVLGWYAFLPGLLGGRCFARARRVPRLDAGALAFRRDADHWPDAVALLDERFWCLPSDEAPATRRPSSSPTRPSWPVCCAPRCAPTPTPSSPATARAPGCPVMACLARSSTASTRACAAATPPGRTPALPALADTARVLPGGTPEFADASTVGLLTDDHGRTHLIRTRVSCCYYDKLPGDHVACFGCPRTPDGEWAARAAGRDEVR